MIICHRTRVISSPSISTRGVVMGILGMGNTCFRLLSLLLYRQPARNARNSDGFCALTPGLPHCLFDPFPWISRPLLPLGHPVRGPVTLPACAPPVILSEAKDLLGLLPVVCGGRCFVARLLSMTEERGRASGGEIQA